MRRGLFIISPTGVLRQMTINDLPVGRSVDETLRLVKAFQVPPRHALLITLPPDNVTILQGIAQRALALLCCTMLDRPAASKQAPSLLYVRGPTLHVAILRARTLLASCSLCRTAHHRLFVACQFTDEHGEVCPANWRPGGATIKPDPKGSKAYFAKQKN